VSAAPTTQRTKVRSQKKGGQCPTRPMGETTGGGLNRFMHGMLVAISPSPATLSLLSSTLHHRKSG
jgi:hypothetical protein